MAHSVERVYQAVIYLLIEAEINIRIEIVVKLEFFYVELNYN